MGISVRGLTARTNCVMMPVIAFLGKRLFCIGCTNMLGVTRMRHRIGASGFSLIELLVSMAIILVLLMAICGAIIQTLHVEALHVGRAAMGRSVSQLASRMQEDARSSTAVFIPSVDILGNSNSGSTGAHEVDFFRRLSAGGDTFVAYRYDAASAAVTRYEYSSALGIKSVLASDLAAGGIASLVAQRKAVAASSTVAGQTDPQRVTILYGTRELAGGNDIVVVTIATQESGGAPSENFQVHLAARAAPTSLAILAPAGPPSRPPPTTVIPFVILRPGFQLHLPHGPIHWGSVGADDPFIHWVAAAGAVQFFGSGLTTAGSWFEFSSLYAKVTSGQYTFKQPDGSFATATISCIGGACPIFHPLPVSAPGFTPAGGVAFQESL